jgi:hypothetical protein
MSLMDGLATYQIIKTGFFLFLIVLFLCIAIGLVFYNLSKNYLSTTICDIKSIPNSNYQQTVSYLVNGKAYKQTIPGTTTTTNNVTTTTYAYPEGKCTMYYASANPNDYSLNFSPTTASGIFAGVLFVIALLMTLYFIFLRSNKEFAGVMGGIDAAQTAFSVFTPRRY